MRARRRAVRLIADWMVLDRLRGGQGVRVRRIVLRAVKAEVPFRNDAHIAGRLPRTHIDAVSRCESTLPQPVGVRLCVDAIEDHSFYEHVRVE